MRSAFPFASVDRILQTASEC